MSPRRRIRCEEVSSMSSRFWTHAVHEGEAPGARVALLVMIFVWLGGTAAQAQAGRRAVRPNNQSNRAAIEKLALTGRPCSLIGSLGLHGNAEAVLAALGEMQRRREVRFDGERASSAGRGETMMLDMRDHEVAGILLATVVYRDCVSQSRSAPSFRLDVVAAGRLVFRQDAQGRITSFGDRTARRIRSARLRVQSCAQTHPGAERTARDSACPYPTRFIPTETCVRWTVEPSRTNWLGSCEEWPTS